MYYNVANDELYSVRLAHAVGVWGIQNVLNIVM